MSATATSVTEYLFEAKPLWTGSVGSGGVGDGTVQTIPLQAASNLDSGDVYVVTLNRVDVNGTKTTNPASNTEVLYGKLSGTNLINSIRGVEGTAQAWDAGTVVEILFTATHWNKLIEFLGVEHTATGTHGDITATSLDTTGATTLTQISTPASPSAGRNKLYFKSDDLPYTLTSGGVEYQIGSASSLSRQAIINGNFDVWQRGTTSTNPTSAALLSDRWITITSFAAGGALPTNVVHSRQSITAGDIANAFYHYRVAPDGAGTLDATGSSLAGLMHKTEYGTRYLCGASKQVTVSFWARSSIANKKIGVYLSQRYGTGGSPTANEDIAGTKWTLTSTWTKYTHTFTTNTLASKTFGTANDDVLALLIGYVWGGATNQTLFADTVNETFVGSGTIDIAQVQLNAGSTALAFQPKSFAQELADCQRYFFKTYANNIFPGNNFGVSSGEGNGVTAGFPPFVFRDTSTTNRKSFYVSLPVEMRTTPTIKYYDLAGTLSRMTSITQHGAWAANALNETYQAVTGSTRAIMAQNASSVYGFCCHITAEAEL